MSASTTSPLISGTTLQMKLVKFSAEAILECSCSISTSFTTKMEQEATAEVRPLPTASVDEVVAHVQRARPMSISVNVGVDAYPPYVWTSPRTKRTWSARLMLEGLVRRLTIQCATDRTNFLMTVLPCRSPTADTTSAHNSPFVVCVVI